ncbi:hypothetical protein M4R22_13520 [Acidovorax sp. GBBC 3334]|uniref:hypothetical protein n=1 Tax=Acidovorax sp. GBBC 3334 TaxID=2940496 RepID=UPI002302CB61|nr:hypothetical protein [Acidovorax sp. GBBC 3334]MDA8455787.1 hypothetical protein [Acidovorax sp. GBBC 3334]
MTFRTLTRTGLIAALIACGAAQAQPLPPAAPGQPPAPIGQPPAVESATHGGTLQRWLLNPNGEADGLLMQDGTQVAFPPHLSQTLTGWLRVGDALEVTGWNHAGVPVLRASTLRSQGRTVEDTPPVPGQMPPPPSREALAELQTDGRVARVLLNSRGDAHGLLLDNGVIVRFPPHVAASVGNLLQTGATVSARGWGTRNALGTALEATQLGATPDTLQDVLRGPAGGPPRLP